MENAVNTLGFSPEGIWITLGTLLAGAGGVLLILQLIRITRELRQPALMDAKSVQEKLRNDHARLNTLEQATTRQEQELKLILRAQITMMHHIVDGNGVENLKAMQRQIEEYLVYGRIQD